MNKTRVLVADDIEIMRSLLRSTLATFDCEVVAEVDNGIEVLEQAHLFQPDIIFLDISMPGKTGLEVLQEKKEQVATCFVVMISGLNTFENIKSAMELGADGFVVKPYTAIKIREMIHKYRKTRGGPSQA